MIHSLRVRLLLAFMLVLGVALAGVLLLASRSTTTEFQGFMERRSETEFRRLLEGLSRYYADNQGWSGVQAFVERASQLTGGHVLLADSSGTIVADSEGRMIGQPAGRLRRGAPVLYRDAPVGTAYVNPGAPPEIGAAPKTFYPPPYLNPGPAPDADAAFLSSVNRSLLLSAAAAALLALVLTIVLSRRILGPVEALTCAARAMERGDLAQRVPIKSSDEVGELARAFNSMAESLARNEQLRKNMVTDVAHELRTPLSNIQGYLEAMRDGVLSPEGKILDSVHEEALHLSRLVDDLQELALAEAGQLRLDRSSTDIAEVVDRALRAATPEASAKGISLSGKLPEGLPPVEIDPGRIGQVLKNLISNALAHTPEGGAVTVSAVGCRPSALSHQPSGTRHQSPGNGGTRGREDAERGSLPLPRGEGWGEGRPQAPELWTPDSGPLTHHSSLITHHFVEVSVSDTGSGIPPEHLPYIFERFYRVDPSRTRSTGGSGIGLAIARQLVEAHGGRIWAESQPREGSSFHFTVPLAGLPKGDSPSPGA